MTTTAYDLLSEPIRKFVRDKRWESLRPIQTAAISRISTTDNNYILASRTASGKTEAAFLPILSRIDTKKPGVQVLYISPLIALINDQFFRIEDLCKNLDIRVTKWHGEANKTLKEQLVKEPNGVVLITPESLEAMFVNKLYQVKHIFSNLDYIVIDEIHSFIGTDRGIQLKSILYRLQSLNKEHIKIIGLSATLGDYNESKKFTGNEYKTVVLLDRAAKDINAKFSFFKKSEDPEIQKKTGLSIELLKDLYSETKDRKVLIFPNSRGLAEEIAVKLKQISDKVNGHKNYFTHHSSIDKDVRQYVEYFAKSNIRENFCITCTSTLELGIDIGSVDSVFQIDSTSSIASLIQRVGRSGRKDDQPSNLYLYATNVWDLLQSLACWLLFKEGFIEPPYVAGKPYDILLHQALSITKSTAGIKFVSLVQQLKSNYAFNQIEVIEIHEIIEHLIANDLLEKIKDEVILGLEGERVVNVMDFYSVFQPEDNYKVVNAGNVIGQLPLTQQIIEGENIFLAAKIWKIKFIDNKAKRIEVVRSPDGKAPFFNGNGNIVVHHQIRQKMLEILASQENYSVLNQVCQDELNILRNKFKVFAIKDVSKNRPILINKMNIEFYTFAGTKENSTLHFLFRLCGCSCKLEEASSCLIFESKLPIMHEVLDKWKELPNLLKDKDIHLTELINKNSSVIGFSKYGHFLPIKYQVSLLKDKIYDFNSISNILEQWVLTSNIPY